MIIDNITSAQNPRIKDLLALQGKSKERRSRGRFVVEGQREVARAIASGFIPETFFFCENLCQLDSIVPSDHKFTSKEGNPIEPKYYNIPQTLYEKIAYRSDTEGIIAIFISRKIELTDLKLSKAPLIIVLESVEKPGNLGAVLRSADAAGADAVIVCDPLTDIYNPNVIRSSTGAIFSVQCLSCNSEDLYTFLKEHNISILTAQLQDSKLYYDTDMTHGTAIVFGTEDKGLTEFWRVRSDSKIRIPMAGIADSLNVSVSAAILCFEAVRQRQK